MPPKDIINYLAGTIKTTQIHHINNIAVTSAIEKLLSILNPLLSENEVILELVGEFFHVDGTRVRYSMDYIFNYDFLVREFKKRELGTIVFKDILKEDISFYNRKSKGQISIIYGLDSSGSMKGDKLATAKKAGVALACKAIQEKNKVGLIVFGSEIRNTIHPTLDFMSILKSLTMIRASMETNIEKTIKKAIEMFPNKKQTKHLVLLTDALPTKGDAPKKATLEACSLARNTGITISVIGIKLDKDGEKLAKQITEIGEGKLFRVKDLEKVDKVILEDYYSL